MTADQNPKRAADARALSLRLRQAARVADRAGRGSNLLIEAAEMIDRLAETEGAQND